MNNQQFLEKLKQLKIERGEGAAFNSANDCQNWIDDVAPLLKYNGDHYSSFMSHAQYLRITTLSADLLMSHLDPMIGIVNQAITELENDIPSGTDGQPTPPNESRWHTTPTGVIAIGVAIVVLGAIVIWFINNHFGTKI